MFSIISHVFLLTEGSVRSVFYSIFVLGGSLFVLSNATCKKSLHGKWKQMKYKLFSNILCACVNCTFCKVQVDFIFLFYIFNSGLHLACIGYMLFGFEVVDSFLLMAKINNFPPNVKHNPGPLISTYAMLPCPYWILRNVDQSVPICSTQNISSHTLTHSKTKYVPVNCSFVA